MACRNVGRVASSALKQRFTKRNFSAALLSPSYEFPELPFQPGIPSHVSDTSITTLPTGLKVVTENASMSSTVTLTFPLAGSQSEHLSEGGAALANKNLSFKSGSGLSTLLIVRNIENGGASPMTFANRYCGGVGFVCAPDQVNRIVPLLATKCSYEQWDLRDAIGLSGDTVDAAMTDVQTVLAEQIYAAAYGAQSSLGRSFHTKTARASTVISFRERSYISNGAVLAATGIADHDAFVKVVQDGFSDMPAGSDYVKAGATYMGGETRISASLGGYVHIALVFQGAEENTPLTNVMKHCLSLVAGEANAFCAPGLIGLYTATSSSEAPAAIDSLCSMFLTPLTDATISRAKNLAKAEAVFALDSGSTSLAKSMTDSVLESGSFSLQGVSESYDAISSEAVTSAFKAMLASNLSLTTIGDIGTVPYHATVASKFS